MKGARFVIRWLLGYCGRRPRRQSDRILSMTEALIEIFESPEARYAAAAVLWVLGVVAIVVRKLVA